MAPAPPRGCSDAHLSGMMNRRLGWSAVLLSASIACVSAGTPRGGSAPSTQSARDALIEFRLVGDSGTTAFERHEFKGETVFLDSLALLADADLETVRAEVRNGNLIVRFELTPLAAARYREATGRNIDKRMALLLDGQVRDVLIIKSPVGPRGVVAFPMTEMEALRLASLINDRWRD